MAVLAQLAMNSDLLNVVFEKTRHEADQAISAQTGWIEGIHRMDPLGEGIVVVCHSTGHVFSKEIQIKVSLLSRY
jgi:hypothetical protein